MGEPCVQGTPWGDSLFLGIAAKGNRSDGFGFLAGLSDGLNLACARLRMLVGGRRGDSRFLSALELVFFLDI